MAFTIETRKRQPVVRQTVRDDLWLSACFQQLHDLQGVGRSAFPDLVAAAPETEAVRVRQILAQTADPDKILPAGIQGRRIASAVDVRHTAAWKARNRRASVRHFDRLLRPEVNGYGMRAHDGYTYAGAADAQIGSVENPSAFVLHLHFFIRVAFRLFGADPGDDVHGNRNREDFRLCLLPLNIGGEFVLELVLPLNARAGYRLIGADNHGLNGGQAVDAGDRHQRDDCGTVGACDDAAVIKGVLPVNLRDDKRNLRIEAEGGAVVDIDGAAPADRRGKTSGDRLVGGAEDIVKIGEAIIVRTLNRQPFPAKADLCSGAFRPGEEAQFFNGNLIFLQKAEHFAPDGAASAKNGEFDFLHADSFLRLRIAARYDQWCNLRQAVAWRSEQSCIRRSEGFPVCRAGPPAYALRHYEREQCCRA